MPLQYPVTPQGDVVDVLHGAEVADPYRWLEDTDSQETADWVTAQNNVTEAYLADVPSRPEIERRLTELWDYPKYSPPWREGSRWFQHRNSGLQNQPVLYTMDAPGEEGRVLLDPNKLSADGTDALNALSISPSGDLLAYAVSSAGSDWQTWHIRDVASGKDLPDIIKWSKFSTAAWLRDGSGFFYGALEAPDEGREFLDESRTLRIWRHLVGEPQSRDKLMFEAPNEPEWMPFAGVSDDGRWLIVSIGKGTNPENQVHVLNLDEPGAALQPLVADFLSIATVVATDGDTFYVHTDFEADRRRVVAITLDATSRTHWREVIAESEDTLDSVTFAGGHLVAHYLHHATSRLVVHDLNGEPLRQLVLPSIGSVGALSANHDDPLMHVAFMSFVDAGSVVQYRVSESTGTVLHASSVDIDPTDYETEQVFVTSPDGTNIPIFLTRRRDVLPTGDVPTLLYGYGGFGIPLTPSFSLSRAIWMERGGLLAVACLRGGGEYGRAWADAGRLDQKQNVFDDFIACAEWLSTSGWSTSERIAINGGSNGGLLVGACMTQRPELFGAAVPEVGVLDMLRFHKFTIGWAWTSDYGNPDDPDDFAVALAYSPLHNVRDDQPYPPTMVMTGDHDDRVVPGHSFKFAAALQAASGVDAPMLIRVETSAGHGAGKPTAKVIKERTDMLAFLERALGLG